VINNNFNFVTKTSGWPEAWLVWGHDASIVWQNCPVF